MILKYAVRNIFRLKGRSVMFFLIVACVTSLLVLSLIVKEGSEAIIKQTENAVNDYHKVVPVKKADDRNYVPLVRIDMIKRVCTSFSTTEDYVLMTKAGCMGDYILVRPKNYIENTDNYAMTVYGIPGAEYTDCFNNGDKYLIEGREITREDNEKSAAVVMLDSLVADINGFKIGDKITLERLSEAPYLDKNRESWVKKSYEIVGIFKTVAQISGSEPTPMEIENNKIYIPVNSMFEDGQVDTEELYIRFPSEKAAKDFQSYINGHNTYLKEFNLLSPFEIRLVSVKGMNMTKTAPLHDLAAVFSALIVFVSAAGLIAVIISIFLIINQRLKEIGILVSMGMSFKKTAGVFVTEILLLAVVAISVSAGLSLLPSEFIIDSVIERTAAEMSPRNLQNSSVDLLLSENAEFSAETGTDYDFIEIAAVKAFLIISAVILTGCGIMAVLIFKAKPIKILTRSEE
jgi:ABC-type lipoprotein release transport system permease subunit